jgi:hypothetical protein
LTPVGVIVFIGLEVGSLLAYLSFEKMEAVDQALAFALGLDTLTFGL